MDEDRTHQRSHGRFERERRDSDSPQQYQFGSGEGSRKSGGGYRERYDNRQGGRGGYGGGYGGGGYDDDRSKRRKFNNGAPSTTTATSTYNEQDETENRLRSLIVRVGDKSSSSLSSNLDTLSNVLEGDLIKHQDSIVNTILACVVGLPFKTSVYGTLVALLNLKSVEFGKYFVEKLSSRLQLLFENISNPSTVVSQQAGLDKHQQEKNAVITAASIHSFTSMSLYHDLKMILRFIAELVNVNVLLPTSIIQLFNQLLSVINEQHTLGTNNNNNSANNNIAENSDNSPYGSSWNKRSDFFVQLVLLTLPWVGKELSVRKSDELAPILNNIEQYIIKRPPPNPVLHVYQSEQSDDYLTIVWKAIQQLSIGEEAWTINSSLISKPYTAFEAKLAKAIQQNLEDIKVPQHIEGVSIYPHTRGVFGLFDLSEFPKELKTFERLIVHDYIVQTLYHFNQSHKDAVKQIQSIGSFSIDHIIAESVFGELFNFPRPPFRDIYYGTIISDLCKMQPSFPPVLGQAIDIMFERLDSMDTECVDRFSSWFAYHLSNFDYKWNWNNWDYVLKMKADTTKYTFVREVLEKCMRLSYYERIVKTIPESFQSLMPDRPLPSFPFDQNDNALHKQATILFNKLRAKETSENIQALLLLTPADAHDKTESDSEFATLTYEQKIELLVHALLKIGAKSFSHLLAALERYASLLRGVITTSAAKLLAVKVAAEVWANSPQNIIILLERLLTANIVDHIAIIQWVLSVPQQKNFTRSFLWDILRNTINKALSRTDSLKEELRSAEEALEKVPSAERKDDIPEVKRVNDRKASLLASNQQLSTLFSVVFQNFINCISDRFAVQEGTDADFWLSCTFGHLKEVGRRYREHIVFDRDMEELFTSCIDKKVHQLFYQLKSF